MFIQSETGNLLNMDGYHVVVIPDASNQQYFVALVKSSDPACSERIVSGLNKAQASKLMKRIASACERASHGVVWLDPSSDVWEIHS